MVSLNNKKAFQKEIIRIMRKQILEDNVKEILHGDARAFLDNLEEMDEI